ncbi:hypothetical protein CGMCC3_g15864 [Colletotrichum fructicola]|nr:uncharacterized protein CGMCC3_g15864 [Colletotrichum fructicola]KAE9568057.1 hypothetical protein CGMCC3_g15864 [Colletotrichum fructicola]
MTGVAFGAAGQSAELFLAQWDFTSTAMVRQPLASTPGQVQSHIRHRSRKGSCDALQCGYPYSLESNKITLDLSITSASGHAAVAPIPISTEGFGTV